MDPVVHFEMPFEDRDRMAKFYQKAFGWKSEKLGEEMDHYVLATTSESGKQGPKKRGMINGGFYPKKPDWPNQYPSVVIAITDLKKSLAKVQKEGGQVLGEPIEIPGYGKYISIIDTEGNRVGLMQPMPMNSKPIKAKTSQKKTTRKKATQKKK
jgi:uncharacterized protein